MDKPLDELYIMWLYSQIGTVSQRRSSRTYWSLARQLYNKEFEPIVPNDDNRAEDGRDLRYEFIGYEGLEDVDMAWMSMGCSMLEMLIVLSRLLAFEAEGNPRDWFWLLMKNVRLDSYNDRAGVPYGKVEIILNRINRRTYQPNGRGGLFPLKRPNEDQRNVELWYQLNFYLLEMDII